MAVPPVLQGEKVRLRPVEHRDLADFVRWLADPEITQYLGDVFHPPTLEEEEAWYKRVTADENLFVWAIENKEGQLLGNVKISVDPGHQKAELGIFIGEKSQWDHGYGADAIRTVLRYAFIDLYLHRVELETREDNLRAQRCYDKCGFHWEGMRRENRLRDGIFYNTVVMGILRRDFVTD